MSEANAERSTRQSENERAFNRDRYDAVLLDLDGVITDTASVRLHPDVFKNLVDPAVLAVREPTHRFGLRRIVPAPLRELNIARC